MIIQTNTITTTLPKRQRVYQARVPLLHTPDRTEDGDSDPDRDVEETGVLLVSRLIRVAGESGVVVPPCYLVRR